VTAGCPEVHRAREAGVALTPAEREHAASCPLCSEYVEGERTCSGGLPDASRLADRVLLDAAHPGPLLARLSTRARIVLVGAVALAAVAAVGLWRSAPLPSGQTLALVAALLSVGGLVAAIPLTPVHAPAAGRAVLRSALALSLPVILGVIAGASSPLLAGVEMTPRCFAFGSATASVVLAALYLTERRRRPSLGWTVGAAALAGLAGALALDLSCGMGGPVHRALGHGTVGLAWALLLALGFALRPRS
jgi:hypothetical protein